MRSGLEASWAVLVLPPDNRDWLGLVEDSLEAIWHCGLRLRWHLAFEGLQNKEKGFEKFLFYRWREEKLKLHSSKVFILAKSH